MQLAEAFRSLFNEPPVIRMLQRGSGVPYWRATLQYATQGNLQAVVDEYAHLLREPEQWCSTGVERIAEKVTSAVASALTTKVSRVQPHYYRMNGKSIVKEPNGPAIRSHFALRYGSVASGAAGQDVREEAVPEAFKSPFYPFVLVSTSVGQEGLDFHPWCHSVWHWNLPGNPVDLEQREGRVHRYKGHAVRRNVAEAYRVSLFERWMPGQDVWQVLFEIATEHRGEGESELVHCWLAPGKHRVERCVPLLTLSTEGAQLERPKRSLAIYRVVFGQPRQLELVQLLSSGSWTQEEMDSWVVRLEVS